MKAPANFRMMICGNTTKASAEDFVRNGLQWHLPRLIKGEDVPEAELRLYGLTVYVEEDTDQGTEA